MASVKKKITKAVVRPPAVVLREATHVVERAYREADAAAMEAQKAQALAERALELAEAMRLGRPVPESHIRAKAEGTWPRLVRQTSILSSFGGSPDIPGLPALASLTEAAQAASLAASSARAGVAASAAALPATTTRHRAVSPRQSFSTSWNMARRQAAMELGIKTHTNDPELKRMWTERATALCRQLRAQKEAAAASAAADRAAASEMRPLADRRPSASAAARQSPVLASKMAPPASTHVAQSATQVPVKAERGDGDRSDSDSL